jgi:hypothetical protein
LFTPVQIVPIALKHCRPSCLLAAPSDLEDGGWIHAVVSEDGIEAHAKYVVRGGKFVKRVDASATG